MTRYGLSLRRTTNLTVLSDDDLTTRAVRFLTYLSSKKSKLNPSGTLLIDETVLFFEDPRRDTVDFTGARHVVLRSTGFDSDHCCAYRHSHGDKATTSFDLERRKKTDPEERRGIRCVSRACLNE